MQTSDLPDGFRDVLSFGLVEALLGRRSRRFFMGAEIPDGVFKYKSRFEPGPPHGWFSPWQASVWFVGAC